VSGCKRVIGKKRAKCNLPINPLAPISSLALSERAAIEDNMMATSA
jgi:hypothetical protein